MSENETEPNTYKAINWQNFDRRLSYKEMEEIRRRVSGMHFAKETLVGDPITLQALYAAEALLREVTLLHGDSPPSTDEV